MASLQSRLDCAGVSLQRLSSLDRITVLSNSMCHPGPQLQGKPEPVDFHWAVLSLRSEVDIRLNSPTVQFGASGFLLLTGKGQAKTVRIEPERQCNC